MHVRRAKNGDVLIRLTDTQALDLATLVGFIGGECAARNETTNDLYHRLATTLQEGNRNSTWSELFERRKRWRGANFSTLDYHLNNKF